MVSLEEEEAQERVKPEQPNQLHLTLDANLRVQTRRRYLSSMPRTVEELRKKYWVMTHMWLLAKMRQPSRAMYADLDEKNMEHLSGGATEQGKLQLPARDERWLVQTGTTCLEYEFQLRKEACLLIREQSLPIQQALWAAYNDPQHRMKIWITFLTVAKFQE